MTFAFTFAELQGNLCYRREVELKCGMQIPLKEGALMNMGSVTISLSKNVEDLRTKNQDGLSCKEILTDCTVTLRGMYGLKVKAKPKPHLVTVSKPTS